MNDDSRFVLRNALQMMRDHARARLKEYVRRHRMRVTGWHFMLDSTSATGGKVTESGLVLVRCTGERYFCIRVTVEVEAGGKRATPGDVDALEILSLDPARVEHLIFSRDGWTETKAIKKESDKLVENATPAPDEYTDDE